MSILEYAVFCKKIPVSVLEIVDCQGHLSQGNKKDATFICNRLLKHLKSIDPKNNLTDVIMFDGASNVQLGGKRSKVHYPNLTVMFGV